MMQLVAIWLVVSIKNAALDGRRTSAIDLWAVAQKTSSLLPASNRPGAESVLLTRACAARQRPCSQSLVRDQMPHPARKGLDRKRNLPRRPAELRRKKASRDVEGFLFEPRSTRPSTKRVLAIVNVGKVDRGRRSGWYGVRTIPDEPRA